MLLVEQREQQVLDVDLLVVHADGELLCGLKRLLGLLGEAVDVHLGCFPLFAVVARIVSNFRTRSLTPSLLKTARFASGWVCATSFGCQNAYGLAV